MKLQCFYAAIALIAASAAFGAQAEDHANAAPSSEMSVATSQQPASLGPQSSAMPPSPNTSGDAKSRLANALKLRYPTTKFTEINETPMVGIFELVTGKNIFYTNEDGAYLIFGSMYDMVKQRDITAERKEALNKVNLSELDIRNAIVETKGDGSRKLFILTDVDCPYCRQLEQTLSNVTNVTIYRFLYPLDSLHPNARSVSESIWCLGDNEKRLTALKSHMQQGVTLPGASTCPTPLDATQAFAKKYEMFGTPSMVNGKGQILPGAVPLERLEAFINAGGNGASTVVSQSVGVR